LAAGDGPIPVDTAWSLLLYSGTVHTIAVGPLYSPLALESLLESLLERVVLDKAALREE